MTCSESFPAGTAIVVGGSGGIGRAVCRCLAKAGSDVALTFRSNRQAADEAVASIRAEGRHGTATALDLVDRAAVARFVKDTASAFGRIHTLILATGADISMSYIAELDDAEWDRTIEADLTGSYNVMKAVLPHLRKEGGSIVAMTSAALHRYAQKDVLSAVPKAAVEVLVKGIAREEGRFGIRANAVALGVIDAGLFHRLEERVTPEFVQAMKRNTALKRFGTPEEAARLATFLASANASYVTGQSIALDGGYSI